MPTHVQLNQYRYYYPRSEYTALTRSAACYRSCPKQRRVPRTFVQNPCSLRRDQYRVLLDSYIAGAIGVVGDVRVLQPRRARVEEHSFGGSRWLREGFTRRRLPSYRRSCVSGRILLWYATRGDGQLYSTQQEQEVAACEAHIHLAALEILRFRRRHDPWTPSSPFSLQTRTTYIYDCYERIYHICVLLKDETVWKLVV
jgi:hypothetical protein